MVSWWRYFPSLGSVSLNMEVNKIKARITLNPMSVNSWLRADRRGFVYISADGRSFKQLAVQKLEIVKRRLATLGKPTQINGDVKIRVTFQFSDLRKRDTDNYVKPFFDCLKNNLIEDDDKIISFTAKKTVVKNEKPCIRFSIKSVY